MVAAIHRLGFYGVTGGVMEAAVRTAYHVLAGKELEPVEFHPVREEVLMVLKKHHFIFMVKHIISLLLVE